MGGTTPADSGLHALVVESLGTAICSGALDADSMLVMTELTEQFAVSRSVIREALRVLRDKGLLSAKRRVGTKVSPIANWDILDKDVIRWRLAGDQRDDQIRELVELRVAIEPRAAFLAATHATVSQRAALRDLGRALDQAAGRADRNAILDLDLSFHNLVLESSGVQIFAQLGPLFIEMLTGRHQARSSAPIDVIASWHRIVGDAIGDGDAETAHTFTEKIAGEVVHP